jgi:peroxiredoxin
MRVRDFFVLILSVGLGQLNAQTVTLRIEPEQTMDGFVFVLREADPISGRSEVLLRYDLNNQKKAELKFALDETSKIRIRARWVDYPLYAEPGKTYDLRLPAPDKTTPLTFSKKALLEPEFLKPDSSELNFLIAEVNRWYDDFFAEHYMEFAYETLRGNEAWRKQAGEKLKKLNPVTENPEARLVPAVRIDTLMAGFKQRLERRFRGACALPFFQTYLDFTLADLDRIAGADRNAIYERYFSQSPVALRNPAFVHMLEWFNRDFVLQWAERAQADAFIIAFNSGEFGRMDSTFALTTWYPDREFRHAALLMALMQNTSNPLIHPDKAELHLLSAGAMLKGPHRDIALRIKARTDKGRGGRPAPDFKLLNEKEQLTTLSDFKGKHVYFHFYASWCSSCLAEMQQLPKLRKDFGKYVEFVSVSMDADFEVMKQFMLANRQMTQPFLLGSSDPLFMEDWGVMALPHRVMLDPEGNWVKSNAPAPGFGLERDLERIRAKYEQRPQGKGKPGVR